MNSNYETLSSCNPYSSKEHWSPTICHFQGINSISLLYILQSYLFKKITFEGTFVKTWKGTLLFVLVFTLTATTSNKPLIENHSFLPSLCWAAIVKWVFCSILITPAGDENHNRERKKQNVWQKYYVIYFVILSFCWFTIFSHFSFKVWKWRKRRRNHLER